ncbi:TPM domain-containing protein [Roseovarius faecimaris]|uniref:TPM domain-containing protein n=1 Tax=Roseovarius faecimaris TaxID=2494550 RepID=A0A6I6IVN0_9RHOB|nr:TPM domain-containing protein [Roseovarius faecimaris]QGY00135.1 TPM domain-containing protein [Roseovarius faecimaris]
MTRFLTPFFALLLLALPAQAQTYPEYEEIYVNDFADLLTPEEEADIRADLKELRDKRDIEFTVVTINLMFDYGHTGAIEPFATGLFNYWGVGNARRNDGVMMLISRFDRKMRIEVGSGYDISLNAPMKRIIDNDITPHFKADNYPKGIRRGVDAVIYELTGAYPGAIDGNILQKSWSTARRWAEILKWALLPIGGVAGGFGFYLYRRFRRYRPRRCPVDGGKMQLLAEHWDDKHLKEGERREEELKSVDYDVWICPDCEHLTIEAYKSWFSRYSACRACGYKTLEGTTTILQSATTTSTGRKRIDYECHHCDEQYSVTKTIPKVSKSSSSSGGSSSFGGGSSSGGGASGSW